jgi:hypothetical protein
VLNQVLNPTRLPRTGKIGYLPDRLLGVAKDSAKGRELYKKSADKGYWTGKINLERLPPPPRARARTRVPSALPVTFFQGSRGGAHSGAAWLRLAISSSAGFEAASPT